MSFICYDGTTGITDGATNSARIVYGRVLWVACAISSLASARARTARIRRVIRKVLGIAAGIFVLMHPPARAQDLELRRIGTWPGYLRTGASAVKVAGRHAYLTAGELHVFDIADPAHPRRIGGYKSETGPDNLVVSGDYAFLSEYGRVEVIDVRNPAELKHLGAYDLETPWTVSGVAVSGGHLFVAEEWYDGQRVKGRLVIIDVSDPAVPRPVGRFETDRQLTALTMSGTYACIAEVWPNPPNDVGRLRVMDCSNPAQPRLAGALGLNEPVWSITISGNLAYLPGLNGLRVIDLSDPGNPSLVGNIGVEGGVRRLALSNQLAYTIGFGGLKAIKLSDSPPPVPVGRYEPRWEILDLALAGDFACLATTLGFETIDLRAPEAPRTIARFDLAGNTRDLAFAEPYAYLADGPGGLQVLDLSRPGDPRRVAGFDLPWDANGVAVSSNFAYVVGGDWNAGGLRIIDIHNPTNPVGRGVWETNWAFVDVAVSGDYACLHGMAWDGRGALHILNVRSPDNPTWAGVYEFSSLAGVNQPYGSTLAVSGQQACVVAHLSDGNDDSGQLLVLDISKPATPVHRGTFRSGSRIVGLALAGNYACLAEQAGLEVIDISQPSSPRKVGSLTGESLSGVAVSGRYAYFGSGSPRGLLALDLSDPANLREASRFEIGGWGIPPGSLAGFGRYVLAATSGFNFMGGWVP